MASLCNKRRPNLRRIFNLDKSIKNNMNTGLQNLNLLKQYEYWSPNMINGDYTPSVKQYIND